MNPSSAFQHFIGQLDVIGWTILLILGCMSVGTWFLILRKAFDLLGRNRQAREAWGQLRQGHLETRGQGDLDRLLREGVASHRQWQSSIAQGATMLVGDPLERTLGQCLSENVVTHERGLTFLACVAAGAPFVGLFGTVMGIYHALVMIGGSGEAGLEQVAGPVGEALLMTACGLSCAIPAVLAYNFFTRINRRSQAEMERFAHELHCCLTLGCSGREAA